MKKKRKENAPEYYIENPLAVFDYSTILAMSDSILDARCVRRMD